jgi:NAD(P)-dependent dehydrogenase (short-subunit alcohol dehydrogenase family)
MTKTAVITGANRGIGLALTKHYLAQSWQVLALCRQSSEGLAVSSATVIEGIDITSEDLEQKLCEALGDREIDLLINNAGILRDEQLGRLNFDQIRQQFEVNTIGPLRVTEALLPNLRHGAKIAIITSRMGSIEDNESGGRYGYRMSKCALNSAAKSLSVDLKPRDIAVAILHPGLVGTDMIGGHGDVTPDQAAAHLASRIEALNLSSSGTFWHANGTLLPW